MSLLSTVSSSISFFLLKEQFDFLLQNSSERIRQGEIAAQFVKANEGATNAIMNNLITNVVP